jgi:hypothetical protein
MPRRFLQPELRRSRRANRIAMAMFWGFAVILATSLLIGLRNLGA